jgi:hypothetical protein
MGNPKLRITPVNAGTFMSAPFHAAVAGPSARPEELSVTQEELSPHPEDLRVAQSSKSPFLHTLSYSKTASRTLHRSLPPWLTSPCCRPSCPRCARRVLRGEDENKRSV